MLCFALRALLHARCVTRAPQPPARYHTLFHTLMLPSVDALITSCVRDMRHVTGPLCPCSAPTHAHVLASHTCGNIASYIYNNIWNIASEMTPRVGCEVRGGAHTLIMSGTS